MTRVYPVGFEGQAPPEFGLGRNRIGRITIPLDVALSDHEVDIAGTALWAAMASSAEVEVDVAFQDVYSGLVPFREGTFVRVGPFSRVFLTSAAQAGGSITFVYLVDATGNVEIVNPIAGVQDVEITKSDSLSTAADVSLGAGATSQVIAANAGRRELLVTNLAANVETLRVGDSNAGAARGLEVAPGQTITMHTTAAVHAYNPGGSAQSVGVLEVLD